MDFIYAILAGVFVSAISLVGVILLIKNFLGKDSIVTSLVSFAAGALLGDAFLHLLSEHIEEFGYETNTVILIFFGILLMLLIEAYFHCSHDSTEELSHEHKKGILANLNIIGDGMHNFLDGVAIATSFILNPTIGILTIFAIILHEIPQELADASILKYAGWKDRKIFLLNFLTALTALLGIVFAFIAKSIVGNISQYLIPIVVGQFIYIALADLLPEIHKKSGVKKYAIEIGMFVLGIGIMYLLTLVE